MSYPKSIWFIQIGGGQAHDPDISVVVKALQEGGGVRKSLRKCQVFFDGIENGEQVL